MNSSKSSRTRTEQNKIAIAIFAPIFLVLIVLFVQTRYKFVFQTDYSVNFSCGYLDQKDKNPVKGQYYAFVFKAVQNDKYDKCFVKQVSCVSGDTLTHKGRDFYCNGQLLGTAKKFDKKGHSAPLFDYNGVIPPGKYFATGGNKDSYDSRYWGFVDDRWVTGKVHVIM